MATEMIISDGYHVCLKMTNEDFERVFDETLGCPSDPKALAAMIDDAAEAKQIHHLLVSLLDTLSSDLGSLSPELKKQIVTLAHRCQNGLAGTHKWLTMSNCWVDMADETPSDGQRCVVLFGESEIAVGTYLKDRDRFVYRTGSIDTATLKYWLPVEYPGSSNERPRDKEAET